MPKFKKIKKLKFVLIAFFFIPAVVVALIAGTNFRPKAAQNLSSLAIFSNEEDAYTGDLYDLDIQSSPTVFKRTGEGPVYVSSTIFNVHGPRTNDTKELTGYLRNASVPYENEKITFQYNPSGYPRFVSAPVPLSENSCVDLYSSLTAKTDNKYFASFCYKNTYIEYGSGQRIAYSFYGNQYINFNYSGSKPTVIQFITAGFNKLKYPNGIQTRVNYLTVDSKNSTLSDFYNVKYTISGSTVGLSNKELYDWCQNDSIQKYIKQTTSRTKPEGGSNYKINKRIGYCTFEYNHFSLLPFYLSLYKDGWTPVLVTPTPGPLISTTPTPTLAPTPALVKPTPTPTTKPKPTTTPLPTPTGSPFTPARITINAVSPTTINLNSNPRRARLQIYGKGFLSGSNNGGSKVYHSLYFQDYRGVTRYIKKIPSGTEISYPSWTDTYIDTGTFYSGQLADIRGMGGSPYKYQPVKVFIEVYDYTSSGRRSLGISNPVYITIR